MGESVQRPPDPHAIRFHCTINWNLSERAIKQKNESADEEIEGIRVVSLGSKSFINPLDLFQKVY